MTPQFITPCFVHIEDKAYREKVLRELDELGYACACVGYGNDAIVSTHDADYSVDYRPVQSGRVDCGTNTELFLALASMRSDTDKGQWFVYGTDDPRYSCRDWDWYLCDKHDLKNDDPYLRKATAAEITEHLKTKTI